MIVVTGANGQLGSQIVERLLDRVPAERIGVSVRDAAAAAPLAERGVRVRVGDFTEPKTLIDAFEGVTQALVVSPPLFGDEAIRAHRAAFDAARDAGAERILYTSHQAAAADSLFPPMLVHAAAEGYLAEIGVPFTALRNGFYVTTLDRSLPQALESGELVTPASGPMSWTAHPDLAEATAAVLAGEVTYDGPTPPLTGPAAITFDEVAAIASELSGRTIRHRVVSDDEFAALLPPAFVPITLGMHQAARRGEFDVTGPELERLISRPAAPARAYLEGLVTRRG